MFSVRATARGCFSCVRTARASYMLPGPTSNLLLTSFTLTLVVIRYMLLRTRKPFLFSQLLRVTQVSTFTDKCARVPCAQSAEGFVQCHLHVDGSEQQIVLLQVPLDPAESAVVKRRAVKAIGRRVQQDAAGSVDQR